MTMKFNFIKNACLRCLGLLIILPASLFAEVGEYELGGAKQTYDRIPGTFITRHVEWAKPLPGGPIKTFVVCTQSATREVVELSQRLALDSTVLMTGDINYLTCQPSGQPGAPEGLVGGNVWGGSLANWERVIPRLFKERLDPSRQYDLIIVAKVHWDVLPDFARDNIMERVRQGAGLIMVCASPHFYYKEVPFGTPGATAKEDRGAGFPAGLTDLKEATGNILSNTIPLDQLPLIPAVDQAQAQVVMKAYDQAHPEPGLYDGKERVAYNIKSGALGKGRVVVLTYFCEPAGYVNNAFTPSMVYSFKRYDLFQAMFAKLCLYAANKVGTIRLKVDGQNPKRISLEDLSHASFALTVEGEPGSVGQVEWTYRDKAGSVLGSGSLAMAKRADGTVTIRIPAELKRPGEYTLDAWAKDGKGNVLDFVSYGFEVPKPDGIKIVSIGTERDRYQAGETVKGKIVLEGDLPKDGKARLKVRDSWQRLVYTADLPLAGKEMAFSFPIHAPLSTYWEVTVSIEGPVFELASKSCSIAIPNNKVNNFHLIGGGYYWGVIQQGGIFACPELKERKFRVGFEVATVFYPQWADYAARDGWRIEGVVTHGLAHSRYQKKNADGNLINDNCVNNPEIGKDTEQKNWEKICGDRVKAFAKYGNIGSTFNSEGHCPNPCFCKYCQVAFRDYVKTVYKTIERLNEEWNSDYKDFAEVVPLAPAEAFKLNRPVQWVDHQLWHTAATHSALYIKAIKYLRQFDPDLRPSTTDNLYTFNSTPFGLPTFDWPRLSKEMTGGKWDDYTASFVGPYFGLSAMVRSLGDDKGYFSLFGDTFYHHNKADWAHRLLPWWLLYRGFSGVESGYDPGAANWAGAGAGGVTPDGSEPMPWFKGFLETTAEVRRGPATLMLESKFSREPIAIVLSTVNTLASMLDPLADTSATEAIQDQMHVLKVMGVEPHFIGDDEINGKTLAERGFKALILPYNRALSDAQAGGLREFVKNGGLLIADNNPGMMDEHCKTRPAPALDDLFPVTDKLNLNKVGNGYTLYLAGEFRGANKKVPQGEFKGLKGYQETLEKVAGIRPPVVLLNDQGIERYDSESSSYVNNGARYLCLLRNHHAKECSTDTTTVRLPEPRHIYDIRAKKYLGMAGEFSLNLPKDEPKFIGLVPARFLAMEVKMDSNSSFSWNSLNPFHSRKIQPGKDLSFTVHFTFDQDIPFGHGIHVEVLNPQGESLLYYFKNYIFTGKELKVSLPLAYDMAPGHYVLKVTSIVSGMEKEVNFDVR